MAHGLTLELRKIPQRTEAAVCRCGDIFDNHMDKRGKHWKPKKAFQDTRLHRPAGQGNATSYANKGA